MFEGVLLPWEQICHLASYSIFRTTAEVSSKLYFVEICLVSENLWLFNHKRADFGFQILDLKDHFSASLTNIFLFLKGNAKNSFCIYLFINITQI